MFSINSRLDKVLSTFTNTISDLNKLKAEIDDKVDSNQVKIVKLEEESEDLLVQKDRANNAVTYLGRIVGGNV